MDSLTADWDRVLNAPVETSRRTVLSSLQALGFKVDRTVGGGIDAHRGSALRPARAETQRPVRLTASVVGHDGRSRIHVRMTDAGPFDVKSQAIPVYDSLFRHVQADLDEWLITLDPSMEVSDLPSPTVHPEARSWVEAKLGAASRRVEQVRKKGDNVPSEPALWVMAPDATAALSADQAQTCLAVASMVSGADGALPPSLAAQLEELTIALRLALADASWPAGRFSVRAEDKKPIDFLYQQSLIRTSLPVREIRRCRDCRFERVVNPDYRRQAQKSRRIGQVLGVAGVNVGGSGASLFVLAGRLFNMNLLNAPAPCPRCEGTEVDVTLAVICPQCGVICKEPVLTRCRGEGCGYDFRSRAAGQTAWGPLRHFQDEGSVPLAGGIGAGHGGTARGEVPEASVVAPGWYPDPSARHELRWFDRDWTRWASDAGTVVEDPLT